MRAAAACPRRCKYLSTLLGWLARLESFREWIRMPFNEMLRVSCVRTFCFLSKVHYRLREIFAQVNFENDDLQDKSIACHVEICGRRYFTFHSCDFLFVLYRQSVLRFIRQKRIFADEEIEWFTITSDRSGRFEERIAARIFRKWFTQHTYSSPAHCGPSCLAL